MIQNYFSTPIYKVKYDGDLTSLKSVAIPKIKELFSANNFENFPNMMEGALCSYSQIFNIEQWESLKPVSDVLKQHLDIYVNILNVVDNVEIAPNSTWVSYFPPNAYLNYHSHDLSGIATVFYLNKPLNSGNLKLKNNFNIWHHYKNSNNLEVVLDEEVVVEVEEGDIVMFPSFLSHGTERNLSTEDRIIVGKDFVFKKK
jgi:uncharacterized protein (TIGR02466 family)